jgi:class 3 adenylate cyclase
MEPAPELAEFARDVLKCYDEFDASTLISTFSHEPDAVAIGTDPDEWWQGFEAFSAVIRVQFQEFQTYVQRRFEIEEIVAEREGTVGWVSVRANFVLGDNPPNPVRFTIVVHREGTYWRVVQWHGSIPIANEEIFGVELTTDLDELLSIVQNDPPPLSAVASDGSVTIMFTDIVGSTALMESLGEEQWFRMLDWHDGIVKQQTVVFGGTIVKSQGDGFMLAFPAVGSAAACAMAIQRALGSGWAGVQIQVRMGIHSGNAKFESGDFFGRTVVVAARIASAAGSNEILVSQMAQGSLAGAFPLGEARSLTLKGLAGNQTAYHLLWQ